MAGEDWERLRGLVAKDDTLRHRPELLRIMEETRNPDIREHALRKYPEDYRRIRESIILSCAEWNSCSISTGGT